MGPDLKLLVREVPGRRVKDRVSNVTTFKGMTTGAETSVSPVPVALGSVLEVWAYLSDKM